MKNIGLTEMVIYKMRRIIKITTICILLNCKLLHAQVGLITNNPDQSAQLDLTGADDKGLLIPDVGLVALDNPAPIVDNAPAVGLMVYNKNAALPALNGQLGGLGFYYWDGTKWCRMYIDSETAPDNLGNHTATMPLNMNNNDIKNINKQTTTTESIAKGTDGVLPQAGNIAMSADNAGNVVWKEPAGVKAFDKFSFYQVSTGGVITSNLVWKDIPGLSNFTYTAPETGILVLQNVFYARFDPNYASYTNLPFPNAFYQSGGTGVRVQVLNGGTLVDQNCGYIVPKTFSTTSTSGFPERGVVLLQVPVIKGITYTIKTMCNRYSTDTTIFQGTVAAPVQPELQIGTITLDGGPTISSYINAFLVVNK